MITLEKIPDEFRTDQLLLLIGANPLPNYVAALLLSKPKSKIYLLHSTVTGGVAKTLRAVIKKCLTGVETILWQIDPADSAQIWQEVGKIAQEFGRTESIGLNYTGGTKAMSVHVYRALATINRPIIFSYLDADTLSLRFDGNENEQTRLVFASGKCPVSLNELAQLHGYSGFTSTKELAAPTAMSQQVLQDLVEIHLSEEGYTQWRSYGQTGYQALPNSSKWPMLAPFLKTIERFCGANANANDAAVAMGRFPKLASYSNWFNGTWLEEYVLGQIEKLQDALSIQDVGMGLMPIVRGNSVNRFELDVAAMRGYQLFAISCMVAGISGQKPKNNYKEHLLEIYVRARQLGGDEARIALVCHYEDAAQLEAELKETWFSEGRIRVFGRKELRDLSTHLRNWFQTANL